ncbi:putative receptor-like protein kinase [Cocos nucifera]|uniref:Putative receptor-like protein kinase n=1 Tax=Cocos nucifera TaxID=13894 RepID=A0A8K0HVX8_COCNU|nr:putative receptor-like protein kinase [Cocos nucifera]
MPSRPLSPSSPPSPASRRHHAAFLAVVSASSALLLVVLALLLLLFYLYRSLRHARARDRTLPLDSPAASSLRRFSFRDLRSATASFDPSRSLGRGASAEVFRGLLPDGKSVAVKRLDLPSSSSSPSSSPPFSSSDREFHNELHALAALPPSPFVVSLLGYCLDGPRHRLLVYEYMPNGSLQETLFSSSSDHHHPVLNWDRRFGIILNVAQALAFLHLECDPPVIHGDIKPSNILLTADFRAKISDFGLSRIKTEADLAAGPGTELFSQELFSGSPQVDFALALRASSSNSCKNLNPMQLVGSNPNTGSSPKGKEAAATTAVSSFHEELCSMEHGKELSGNSPLDDGKSEANGQWGRDWWWKQDGSGELSSRDYVREWIGSQICPSSNADWDDARKNSPENCFESRNSSQAERLDGGDDTLFRKLEEKRKKTIDGRDKKNRKMREWWKEEYFAEISKKRHSKKGPKWFRSISSRGEVSSSSNTNYDVGKRGRESNMDISFRKGWKKKRSRSVGSDMFSGDLLSRELSSTTSMRGTVCYVAPEYGGCGHLMEKADIYSFGVLILVIVSGRRPLHVLSSPMKLEKANLISWCRQLAQTGNILELVDEKLKNSYNKEQANLCINLALSCLQRMPEMRPDSGDIVKILKGEMELPVVPFEYSPSPPAKLISRSRRKTTPDAE